MDEPKSQALRHAWWRERILDVIAWRRGEGLGESVDPAVLEDFLELPPARGRGHLEGMVEEGLLHPGPGDGYRLTGRGEREVQRLVREGAGAPDPRPGPCGAVCWCHHSPVEAAACAATRRG